LTIFAIIRKGFFHGFGDRLTYGLFHFAYDVPPKLFHCFFGRSRYGEKLIGFDIQGAGDSLQHIRAWKFAGNLYHGDKWRGNSGFFGQFFLRKTASPAVFLYIACQYVPNI
jgi:hypothetical protein